MAALTTLLVLAAVVAAPVTVDTADRPASQRPLRTVMFVGNNHDGTADVVDARTFEALQRIDMIPDHDERMAEISGIRSGSGSSSASGT